MEHKSNSEWAHSFWDCCSPFKTCTAALCCGCFLHGKTQARRRDPALNDFSYCNSDCVAWLALACCGVQWILQTVRRSNMREELGINGSGFGDCCGAYWCPSCGLLQEEKEMIRRTEMSQGTGYQAPQGMKYPAAGAPPS